MVVETTFLAWEASVLTVIRHLPLFLWLAQDTLSRFNPLRFGAGTNPASATQTMRNLIKPYLVLPVGFEPYIYTLRGC